MVFEQKWTDDELLEVLKAVRLELGRTPKMSDLREKDGRPHPSLYQKRFASKKFSNDGWNRALELAGFKINRRIVDPEEECVDCGVNGKTNRGRLIRWQGKEIVCTKCYQKRSYQERKRT